MLAWQVLLAGVVVLLLGVSGMLLLIPGKTKKTFNPKKTESAEKISQEKDWPQVCEKLKSQIQGLRRELEQSHNQQKGFERDLLVEREKYVRLQEKLTQERGWQKREEESLDKKAKETLLLKDELKAYESKLEESHTLRLRLQSEQREMKDSLDAVTEARRNLEIEGAKLQATLESARREIRELKEQNARISQRQDAETWVSKVDYQKLEMELRNKDKDLARLKELLKKDSP